MNLSRIALVVVVAAAALIPMGAKTSFAAASGTLAAPAATKVAPPKYACEEDIPDLARATGIPESTLRTPGYHVIPNGEPVENGPIDTQQQLKAVQDELESVQQRGEDTVLPNEPTSSAPDGLPVPVLFSDIAYAGWSRCCWRVWRSF